MPEPAPQAKPPAISVVIASQDTRAALCGCLERLAGQTQLVPAELIVVDASTDGSAEIAGRAFPQVQVIHCPPGTLVPVLWQEGLEAARAPIVAFTLAQCLPSEQWLQAILAAQAQGAAAVAGPLSGPSRGDAVAWAVYFARYSAWMPPGPSSPVLHDLPGDNSAYRRAALEPCRVHWQDGFWETPVNACLTARGERLAWAAQMQVEYTAGIGLGPFARARFVHGRHYASTRFAARPLARLIHFAGAPLLMPLLLARIWRRVRERRPDWLPHFWTALPALIVFMTAWALGEASGYLLPEK